MKNITINGHEWRLKEILKFPVTGNRDIEFWVSGFFCSDGDGIELFIETDESGFELSCFSGIGSSKIYIDQIDMGIFNYVPNKIESLDFNEPFNIRCLKIADYLCSKFCEYQDNTKNG